MGQFSNLLERYCDLKDVEVTNLSWLIVIKYIVTITQLKYFIACLFALFSLIAKHSKLARDLKTLQKYFLIQEYLSGPDSALTVFHLPHNTSAYFSLILLNNNYSADTVVFPKCHLKE